MTKDTADPLMKKFRWLIIVLMAVVCLAFVTPAEAAGPDCSDGNPATGYWDRGTCVPGMIDPDTWWEPAPQHIVGKAVWYAPNMMEGTARYRGMSLEGYLDGVAMMSPGDLGETVWIKRPGFDWEGPYLVVDCSQRNHMWVNVVEIGEVIEVGFKTALRWGMVSGNENGYNVNHWMFRDVEVWKGASPPDEGTLFNTDFSMSGSSKTAKIVAVPLQETKAVSYRDWFLKQVSFTTNMDLNPYAGHLPTVEAESLDLLDEMMDKTSAGQTSNLLYVPQISSMTMTL